MIEQETESLFRCLTGGDYRQMRVMEYNMSKLWGSVARCICHVFLPLPALSLIDLVLLD